MYFSSQVTPVTSLGIVYICNLFLSIGFLKKIFYDFVMGQDHRLTGIEPGVYFDA